MRGVWLSRFSINAMPILCLSLVGRWWRAECETGQFCRSPKKKKKDSTDENPAKVRTLEGYEVKSHVYAKEVHVNYTQIILSYINKSISILLPFARS